MHVLQHVSGRVCFSGAISGLFTLILMFQFFYDSNIYVAYLLLMLMVMFTERLNV